MVEISALSSPPWQLFLSIPPEWWRLCFWTHWMGIPPKFGMLIHQCCWPSWIIVFNTFTSQHHQSQSCQQICNKCIKFSLTFLVPLTPALQNLSCCITYTSKFITSAPNILQELPIFSRTSVQTLTPITPTLQVKQLYMDLKRYMLTWFCAK